jgi:dTDP-4-dehydrorhamnose 3,5-epimerase
VDLEPRVDMRGFFARSFCMDEFAAHGLDPRIAQANMAFNVKAGTLRGMHFQVPPHEEAKYIRCVRGSVYDVAVDIRPKSPTYLKWHAEELTADNRRMMCISRGFAHGYQTLADNTEVLYLVSEFYHPESDRGLRWDDPAVGISWPLPDPILSEKDRAHSLLERVPR